MYLLDQKLIIIIAFFSVIILPDVMYIYRTDSQTGKSKHVFLFTLPGLNFYKGYSSLFVLHPN
jgi:hypothetical protein